MKYENLATSNPTVQQKLKENWSKPEVNIISITTLTLGSASTSEDADFSNTLS